MPIKQYRPTSPGRRGMSVSTFEEITKTKPEKALTEPLRKTAGRNNNGRITTRHRGGGHKRMYRIIDWKRDKIGVAGRVIAIEYDPNRSARIALVQYADLERRYIIAPVGVRVGMRLSSGPEADLSPGNALALKDIPVGSIIHNIELTPGQVGNPEHATISIGKAGRTRHLGFRPTVRGAAMNPRDHPHGGGEGKAPIGGQPQTKWGKIAMGKKTRHRKATDKFIVRRRN